MLEIHNKIEKTPTSSVVSRQSSHSDYGSSRGGPISASHQLYASPQSIVHRTNSDTVEGLGSNEKTLLKELCNVSLYSLEHEQCYVNRVYSLKNGLFGGVYSNMIRLIILIYFKNLN